MAQVINTNIMSLNAQRQLNKSQLTQNEAMERLSSGLRINSAKDDAAGLAISTGMQSQIKGMNQAVRNANDGVSMAQTAEGSMDEMTNILQRMRELSVQSANATNSSDNRQSIQTEVDQLYAELGRISESTQFNGTNLLDGSSENVTLQIGANNGDTMQVNFTDVTAHALGIDGGVTKGDLNGDRVADGPIAENAVQINGVDIGAVDNANKLGAAGIAEAINKKTNDTNVTAEAYNSIEGAISDDADGMTVGLEITVGTGATVTLNPTNSMENLRDTINKEVSGVQATISSEGQLQLTNTTGESIEIGGADIAGSGIGAGKYEGYVALSSTTDEPIKVTGATTEFGLNETNGAGSLTGANVSGTSNLTEDDQISINGEALTVTGTKTDYNGASMAEKAEAINALTEKTGVTATVVTVTAASEDFKGATAGTETVAFTQSDLDDLLKDDGSLAGIKYDLKDVTVDEGATLAEFVGALNESDAGADYTFTVNGSTGFIITANEPGATPVIPSFTIAAGTETGSVANAADTAIGKINTGTPTAGTDNSGTDIPVEKLVLTAAEGTEIVITSDADSVKGQTDALAKLGVVATGGAKADDLGIDVTTAEHAGRSLEMIDKALSTISSARADLGAVQNRLDSTISNLENVSQNLSASNSRIQDADFAAETSKMSKAQILQQAGTSMLSQANASTQNVLSLLQG